MNSSTPISILIDNCVASLCDTMNCVQFTKRIELGGVRQTVNILGFKRKKKPNSNESWKLKQLNSLPTVEKLALDGIVDCYTYSELRHEGWKRLGSFPATIVGHLFSDVNFVDVEAAVERSYFFQSVISEYISTEQMIQFCKWLLDTDFGPRINTQAETGKYLEFLIKNLRNIDRYRTLCVNLSEGQYVDAFHLWTAEVNGIQYFLTTERKFIRAMTQSKNIELPCTLISPEQLLEELEVKERLPFPHPENTTIDIFGNPV